MVCPLINNPHSLALCGHDRSLRNPCWDSHRDVVDVLLMYSAPQTVARQILDRFKFTHNPVYLGSK